MSMSAAAKRAMRCVAIATVGVAAGTLSYTLIRRSEFWPEPSKRLLLTNAAACLGPTSRDTEQERPKDEVATFSSASVPNPFDDISVEEASSFTVNAKNFYNLLNLLLHHPTAGSYYPSVSNPFDDSKLARAASTCEKSINISAYLGGNIKYYGPTLAEATLKLLLILAVLSLTDNIANYYKVMAQIKAAKSAQKGAAKALSPKQLALIPNKKVDALIPYAAKVTALTKIPGAKVISHSKSAKKTSSLKQIMQRYPQLAGVDTTLLVNIFRLMYRTPLNNLIKSLVADPLLALLLISWVDGTIITGLSTARTLAQTGTGRKLTFSEVVKKYGVHRLFYAYDLALLRQTIYSFFWLKVPDLIAQELFNTKAPSFNQKVIGNAVSATFYNMLTMWLDKAYTLRTKDHPEPSSWAAVKKVLRQGCESKEGFVNMHAGMFFRLISIFLGMFAFSEMLKITDETIGKIKALAAKRVNLSPEDAAQAAWL